MIPTPVASISCIGIAMQFEVIYRYGCRYVLAGVLDPKKVLVVTSFPTTLKIYSFASFVPK